MERAGKAAVWTAVHVEWGYSCLLQKGGRVTLLEANQRTSSVVPLDIGVTLSLRDV